MEGPFSLVERLVQTHALILHLLAFLRDPLHFHFNYSLQKYFTRRLNAEKVKCLSVPFEVEHQTTLSTESASKFSDKTMHL